MPVATSSSSTRARETRSALAASFSALAASLVATLKAREPGRVAASAASMAKAATADSSVR